MSTAENIAAVTGGVVAVCGGIATVVSALKVSCRGNAKSAEEFDEVEREAEVFLFTSRLSPLPDSREFHHWALVIFFEGNDIRTVEGLVDEESKLYAVYSKVQPKEDGKYYSLGKIFISPKKILKLCKSNKFNTEDYMPTWQNCQTWVKELAAMIGEGISSMLEQFPTLMEVRPTFSKIVNCSHRSSQFASRPLQKMFKGSKIESGPKND